MSEDMKADLLNRISLVDGLIVDSISKISSLTENLHLEHIQLGKFRDNRQKLDQHVSNLNEIQEMLGTSPASMAPSPSSDVPPPSSVSGGEPITIEVNHVSMVEAPRTGAEKIIASLTSNPDQTIAELVEKFGVTRNYAHTVCAKHNLKFKRVPNGRPSKFGKVVETAISEAPELGNRTIARKLGCSPKLVREARKKIGAPKSPAPVGRPKAVASTALATRPRSVVQQKSQPVVEPSKRHAKILNRIVERETGKHLHQDLLGMKRLPVFVDGVSFAWQGTESQLVGCAKLMKFDVSRLKENDPTYPYFSQKFEA